jgi:hypothetical protein
MPKIEGCPRPETSDEDFAFAMNIRHRLASRADQFDQGDFVECDACSAKPGSPELCAGCLANRHTIGLLRRALRASADRNLTLEELALSLEHGHHPLQRAAGAELRKRLGGKP